MLLLWVANIEVFTFGVLVFTGVVVGVWVQGELWYRWVLIFWLLGEVFSMALRVFIFSLSFCFGALAFAEGSYGVDEVARRHLGAVQATSFDLNSCGAVLSVVQADLKVLDWDDYSNATLNARALGTMQLFWQLRLALHSKLEVVGRDCTLQIRDVFYRLRDAEDYLSEFAYAANVLHPENVNFFQEPTPFWDRTEYPYSTTLIRSDLNPVMEFRSGDVLLARGTSFISAIISRMSDNKSGYSHSLIWNIDPVSKVANSVESYLDSGVQTFEAVMALRNENVRLTVLRPKDAALGARAASIAMKAAAAKIPYDFKLDYADPRAMSCVEVVTSSFGQASGGQMSFPLYPGKLAVKDKTITGLLGLKGQDLIAPVDLETDPRFELVADWIDNRIVRDSRHKDAILSEMLRWIDQMGYEFNNTAMSMFVKYILKPARTTRLWPMLEKLTGASINAAMPRSTLGVVVVLNQVGKELLKEVRRLDAAYIAKHGRPMTSAQLRQALEKFRAEDLRRYNDNEYSAIHSMINPYSTQR